MTSVVPAARERGILRLGSLTSPAVKVMLFQASEEKSEPTWETQKAMNKPKAPPVAITVGRKDKPDLIGSTSCGVQIWLKLTFKASLWAKKMPTKIRTMSESVLAEVKMFWMSLPI